MKVRSEQIKAKLGFLTVACALATSLAQSEPDYYGALTLAPAAAPSSGGGGTGNESPTLTGGSPDGDLSKPATVGSTWITKPAAAPANSDTTCSIRGRSSA